MLGSVKDLSATDLFCLVVDADMPSEDGSGVVFHSLDVLQGGLAVAIKKKYKGNRLRWSCKPLYLAYLIQLGYDSVIYVDNDVYFFSSPDFLFEKLEHCSVLLTPHHYPMDPASSQNWLEANYRVGLYNAGFVGVSQSSVSALDWWAECCLYNVKKSAWRGLFDDQKYLDLLPIIFDGVEVLKHRGCNVAGWNATTSIRSVDAGGGLVLASRWPLVFIHFTPLTYRYVLEGKDDLLEPFLNIYQERLRAYNPFYRIEQDMRRGWGDLLLYFRYIRWHIARWFE